MGTYRLLIQVQAGLRPCTMGGWLGDAALERSAVLEHLPVSVDALEHATVLAVVICGKALELTLSTGRNGGISRRILGVVAAKLSPCTMRSWGRDAALERTTVLDHLPISANAFEYTSILAVVICGKALAIAFHAHHADVVVGGDCVVTRDSGGESDDRETQKGKDDVEGLHCNDLAIVVAGCRSLKFLLLEG